MLDQIVIHHCSIVNFASPVLSQIFTCFRLLLVSTSPSCSAAVKPLPTDEALFPKLTVMPLLLVPRPIFKTIPVERRRIMEPFINLPQTTHVILELRAIVVVATVCPLKRASHVSFLTFLATGVEVDDHCSIVHGEHDVRRINIVMDDAEAMKVLNASLDLLKTILSTESSSVMIDSLDQVLVVPGEAKTPNTASSENAAVIGSDVRVRMAHENLTDSSFSKHELAQTSWCS